MNENFQKFLLREHINLNQNLESRISGIEKLVKSMIQDAGSPLSQKENDLLAELLGKKSFEEWMSER